MVNIVVVISRMIERIIVIRRMVEGIIVTVSRYNRIVGADQAHIDGAVVAAIFLADGVAATAAVVPSQGCAGRSVGHVLQHSRTCTRGDKETR